MQVPGKQNPGFRTLRAPAKVPLNAGSFRFGFVEGTRELALAQPHLDRLRVRCSGYDQPVKQLSGGNQQKVVLSKWLATKPRIFIFDEPTQGVDVQTKAEVHAMIASLAEEGAAIVMISSELPELIGGSDRIIVLREGVVAGEFLAKDATQEGIMQVATAETTVIDSPSGGGAAQPDAGPSPAKPAGGFSLRRLRDLLLVRREVGLVAAILLIIIPATILNPRMLGVSNLKALSMDVALLSIVAVAQMLVLITRNIDLSVASVISLSAYVSAMVLKAAPQTPIQLAILIACAVGLVCGLINGAIITYGRIPAITATLGTLTLFRGFNSLLANGVQIIADQVLQAWLDITAGSIFGVPVVGIGAGAVNGYIVCRLGLPSLIVTLGTMALFRGLGYILLGTGAINELPDSLTNFGLNNIGSTAIPWITLPFIVSAVLFIYLCAPVHALGPKDLCCGRKPCRRVILRHPRQPYTLRVVRGFRADERNRWHYSRGALPVGAP